jgi:hypothetical protein
MIICGIICGVAGLRYFVLYYNVLRDVVLISFMAVLIKLFTTDFCNIIFPILTHRLRNYLQIFIFIRNNVAFLTLIILTTRLIA